MNAENTLVPTNEKLNLETYESEAHNREKYNEIAFKLMSQAGVKVIEKY